MGNIFGRSLLSNQQLDDVISKTLRLTATGFETKFRADDLLPLCLTVTSVLRTQPPFVETTPPMIICGDIHGQFADLKTIFETIGYPPQKQYMFLGDIVDRGDRSVETAVLLMAYKARYPDSFFLLRGNHECGEVNKSYGFYEEIERRYGRQNVQRMWAQFNDVFAWLPYCGMVGDSILCMHGGVSPQITSLQQLRELRRPYVDPPEPSLELDLLWADPAEITGVQPNHPRGISIVFGPDVLNEVCKRLNISLVVRAHQVCQDGAQFFGTKRQLLTIFSAPHYEGQTNVGCVLIVDGPPPLFRFRFFT